MNTRSGAKVLIPQLDGRALDFIKIAALAFMVIDHIDAMLLERTAMNMWFIGRATFPLFAYAIAMGIFKAGPDRAPEYGWKKYLPRLLIFALIAEPICQMTRDVSELNVLFTLGLGAAFAGLTYRMSDRAVYLCHVLAAAGIFFPSVIEFGTPGIVLPSALLMILRGKKMAWPFLMLLIFAVNLASIAPDPEAVTVLTGVLIVGLAAGLGCTIIPLLTLRLAQDIPQNGRFLSKYFLHLFYPAHFLVIWATGHFLLQLP
jgi:hypothetical protein